jgi:hypothetical protein
VCGRISLVNALALFTASTVVGDTVADYFGDGPLEVFLCDWRPIRAGERLLQRLRTMHVNIEYKETVNTDAWRADWPEVPALEVTPQLHSRRADGSIQGRLFHR